MKSILATLCCAAALSAQAALLPQPREYKSLGSDLKVPKIQLVCGVSNLAGNAEFQEALSRIAGFVNGVGGVPVYLEFDAALPKNGYRLTPEISADGNAAFRIAAADRRGFFYAAATLNQLTKTTGGDKAVTAAVITDYPEWTERYVSDVPESITFERLLELPENKLSGICIRTEGNWQSGEWMQKQTGMLDAVKRATQIGFVDVMFQMHLSPRPPLRKMNFADENDIQLIIDRARTLAESGATAIMLAVDDLTPQEEMLFTYVTEQEKAKFGPNAGRGHGYVTRRVYEALHKDFPGLALSMVVAPYAFENHGVDLEDGAEYCRQWSIEAPVETQLVWTGINVFSPDVTAEQQAALHKLLVKGQKTFIFDNSNGIAAPLPVWSGSRFPGMAEEDEGRTLLWGSWYLRPLERLYYLTANDYLWNPAAYRADESYRRAGENQFGPAAAAPMQTLQRSFQSAEAMMSTTDRAGFSAALSGFEAAFTAAKQLKDRDGKPLPLAQLEPRAQLFRSFIDNPLPSATVNESIPGRIVLSDRKDASADPAPTTAEISAGTDGLHIVFNVPNQDIPEPAELEHDENVYLSPDCVEMFIQPTSSKAVWLNSEPPSYGYAHLVFDSSANRYDENGVSSPLFYNPEWTVKTAETATGWRAEVFVPYSAFKPMEPFYQAPSPGVVWRANFHRVNNKSGLVQSWNPGGDKFHAPEFFGELRWLDNVR
ncbi:MAG: beta-N-acetylglucosaminidase domain-containing protein [Victivallaceae bacterium]|nr:beta-N-acetylglucosaminidase domain-containing protein [Victivallaceae bacterium]